VQLKETELKLKFSVDLSLLDLSLTNLSLLQLTPQTILDVSIQCNFVKLLEFETDPSHLDFKTMLIHGLLTFDV
jgi:hypothetical protein